MRLFLSRQLQGVGALFRPPFEGLWLALLLYYFWCFFVHPESQILRGNLPDPDDYMYLDQLLDWLKGQGWYDNVQHRIDPPLGAPIHFSRLAQVPMAALTLLFEALGVKPKGAALLMAVIEPPILFGFFFAAVRWLGKEFLPRGWAGVTAFVALFGTGVLFAFSPGHVDHHGLVLTLVVFGLGAALRMMRQPEEPRWAVLAGAFLAAALAIALEVLPWIAMISGWLGLWAAVKGGKAARSGIAYGLGLYLASIALLALARPPLHFFAEDIQSYSIVYVFLTGGIAVSFAAVALGGKWPVLRIVLGGSTAALCGTMFLRHFPALLGGPWGGVEKEVASLLLDNMYEAQPLFRILGHDWLKLLVYTLYPLLALGMSVYFLKQAKAEERWRLGLAAVLLAAAIGLGLFYQFRFQTYMGAFSILPLSLMLARGWQWAGEHWRGRKRFYAELGLILLAGPLPAIVLPAAVNGVSFNTGVLLFPAAAYKPNVCDMYALEQVLHMAPFNDGKPRSVANVTGLGPELLFRAPETYSFLAAPYHMDVPGNIDSWHFFTTRDEKEAEKIARARHLDLVVACYAIPHMYMDDGPPGKKAAEEKTAKETRPHFIERLIINQVPPWLKRANLPQLKNYVIYKVDFGTTSNKR